MTFCLILKQQQIGLTFFDGINMLKIKNQILFQKPNTAVEYVAAHLSKIHGLDWHPDNEYVLATSSQDNSVRVIITIFII